MLPMNGDSDLTDRTLRNYLKLQGHVSAYRQELKICNIEKSRWFYIVLAWKDNIQIRIITASITESRIRRIGKKVSSSSPSTAPKRL